MIKTIAIIIVMVVVNLLMILSISRAAKRVDYSLKKYFVQRLSVDDLGVSLPEIKIPEEPKEEKSILKDFFVFKKKSTPAVQLLSKDNVSAASYKSDSLKHDYRAIKKISYYTPENALVCAKKQIEKSAADETYKDYAGLLKMLDYDTVFSLSVLDPEKQEELIRTSASQEHQSILDDYKAESSKDFDAIDFHAYISQMAEMYNTGFSIKVGDIENDGKKLEDGTDLVFDDQICEGAQVIYKNKLYDYSI